MSASDLALNCFFFGMAQSIFVLAGLNFSEKLRFSEAMILSLAIGAALALLLYLKERFSGKKPDKNPD